MSPHFLRVAYTDYAGRPGLHMFRVDPSLSISSGLLSSCVSALQTLTRASIPGYGLRLPYSFTGSGPSSSTFGALTFATFLFSVTGGSNVLVLSVPGPDPSIFLTDHSIDPGVSGAADFITSAIGLCVDKSGTTITGFLRGWRTDRKRNNLPLPWP